MNNIDYKIYVKRKNFESYRRYLSGQEYRIIKKVIVRMLVKFSNPRSRLLDIGCWDGTATRYYGKQLGINNLFGIEIIEEQMKKAEHNGIITKKCDLERDFIPFDNNFFDIVIANQVFEHLKQIYRPLSKIHRILKPNGILIFGVPNIASLHSRIQLLFGFQPTSIRLFEAHVRAFTPRALKKFLTFNTLFTIKLFVGSGYYPFPPVISEPLSKIFKDSATFQLYRLRKNEVKLPNWQDEIKSRGLQSNF
jgi:SAM-dependent methyltransferase